MADPPPTPLATCDESLPLLPIMRQFDFGQFVFLHEMPTSSPSQAAGKRRIGEVSRRIVIDASDGRLQAMQEWIERMQEKSVTRPGRQPSGPPVPLTDDLLGGVSLHRLFDAREVIGPVEMKVGPTTLGGVIDSKQIEHAGQQYTLEIDAAAAASLARGEPTLVLASTSDGGAPQFMTQLTPDLPSVTLAAGAVDGLLATGEVQANGTIEHVALRAAESQALLDGRSVVVWTNGTSDAVLRLHPPAPSRLPAESSVEVGSLAEFLGRPQIHGADGLPIGLTLTAAHVEELRTEGATTIPVAGSSVRVRANGSARATAARFGDGGTLVPLEEQERRGPKTHIPERTASAVRPAGLHVAVFMPWRQTWELTGFSRGELRSSLALAPQEETTIEVSSWERRLRTLDQSSQTDIDQSFESSTTERASDDVFSELTKNHDFNWQIDGSMDATYSTGNGSISVSVGGTVADASQLQSIARSTHQGMKESTQKAAAKIRSIRTTHITDSIEGGSQSRVTRQIKNPNFSHTLTLDFFETLAHYKVTLAAVPERLRLVALIDNPMATTEFTPTLIRSNEIALRRALLDSSLIDGFDACRKTSAYKQAIAIIEEQAAMGAVADNAKDPDKGKITTPPPPPTAQERAVVDLLKQIVAAHKTVSSAITHPGDAPLPFEALGKIDAGLAVTPDDRIDAQHWLFLQLASKFLPGLLGVIKALPAIPTIADAGALAVVIPPPGATMSFAKFADVSARDKEDAGLGNAIIRVFGAGTMGWANGQCLANNLYSPDDGGLAGLADALWTAYKAYLAKQSEGDFKADKDVAIANANANQDKLSTADKLAMAFPLDELASAREREEALVNHLKAHQDHYRFALFQGLSPAEQSKYIEDSGLEVGTFEPRVLAISGPQLAVPLAPPPAGELRTFVEGLRTSFADAFGATADEPETFIFPTPGISINSRLGECPATEDFIEDSRQIELRRLAALADSAEHEAARRAARIEANDFDDPVIENAPFHVTVDKPV